MAIMVLLFAFFLRLSSFQGTKIATTVATE